MIQAKLFRKHRCEMTMKKIGSLVNRWNDLITEAEELNNRLVDIETEQAKIYKQLPVLYCVLLFSSIPHVGTFETCVEYAEKNNFVPQYLTVMGMVQTNYDTPLFDTTTDRRVGKITCVTPLDKLWVDVKLIDNEGRTNGNGQNILGHR